MCGKGRLSRHYCISALLFEWSMPGGIEGTAKEPLDEGYFGAPVRASN